MEPDYFCFSSSIPYDVLFSNEYLKDLARLWELHTIIPDPSILGAEERGRKPPFK